METRKTQYKEPFNPEDTPTPPQSMHPGEPNKNENVPGERKRQEQKAGEAKKEDGPKKKLLGESGPDIDDETTI